MASNVQGKNPEGTSTRNTNPVLIGAKDIDGNGIMLTIDANGNLKVATEISSVTATDVTIHDAVTPANKMKVNNDGSIPTQLTGSNMEHYGVTIADRPDASSVPLGAFFMIVGNLDEVWQSNGTEWVVLA